MSEKNTLERLENIHSSYVVDPQVAQRAIEKIRAEEEQKSKNKVPLYKWLPALICALIILAVPITYFLLPPPVVYYDDAKIDLVQEDDLVSKIAENNLTAKIFTESSAKNKLGIISESQKIGYIKQEVYFVTTWDSVEMYVKVLKNSEFGFETDFDVCVETFAYQEIKEIKYILAMEQIDGFDKSVISVNFTEGDNEYFLVITSYGEVEPTAKIKEYLDILFK